MDWRLAPSLDVARREANILAPRRSRASDGTIGDPAHQAQGSASDHNPTAAGWVNALDLTHDPAGGFNAHAWADEISRRNDPRVKYLISNNRIWNPTRGDRPGVWRFGRWGHTQHLHISIRDTPAARNDTSPWFVAGPYTPMPAPPTNTPPQAADHEETDVSFIIAEGFGIYAKVGDVIAPYPDLVSYARDKDRSPGVPVITLSAEQARVIIPNLLKVQAKATA